MCPACPDERRVSVSEARAVHTRVQCRRQKEKPGPLGSLKYRPEGSIFCTVRRSSTSVSETKNRVIGAFVRVPGQVCGQCLAMDTTGDLLSEHVWWLFAFATCLGCYLSPVGDCVQLSTKPLTDTPRWPRHML
ncbi:hypothetical protein NDU88_002780 [Pleurodeles waltl]|uniref:Uncharacterized protein n=1 Tax=Pleurodeles waltl TaxID=8319 RepID=A0AAV7KWS3_PLEWA|nr:hypothetical protein NDU88_002780 [Pleurodeles waltl]